jgi:hypothetical protein
VAAREQGWATCPLTENGFLRIVTNASYPNVRFSAAEAAAYLRALRANHADVVSRYLEDRQSDSDCQGGHCRNDQSQRHPVRSLRHQQVSLATIVAQK